jgi:ribonuclease HI
MKIYCDGSGWNGHVSKFGILILDNNKQITITLEQILSGNVMEYSAIILSAIIAENESHIFSDSQLAVNQIEGKWKTKDQNLIPLKEAASALIRGKKIKLDWIPREQNKADKIV